MSLAWYRHLTTSVAAVPPMIDIQYIYKRRNNSILNPPFPHFVLLLLFFFLSLSPHPTISWPSASLFLNARVCPSLSIWAHTLLALHSFFYVFRRRRRYSFLFLSSSSFPKARERRRISPAIFLVSFIMSTRQKKKRVKKKIPWNKATEDNHHHIVCVHKLWTDEEGIKLCAAGIYDGGQKREDIPQNVTRRHST